jgi:hypothetical protein
MDDATGGACRMLGSKLYTNFWYETLKERRPRRGWAILKMSVEETAFEGVNWLREQNSGEFLLSWS